MKTRETKRREAADRLDAYADRIEATLKMNSGVRLSPEEAKAEAATRRTRAENLRLTGRES